MTNANKYGYVRAYPDAYSQLATVSHAVQLTSCSPTAQINNLVY